MEELFDSDVTETDDESESDDDDDDVDDVDDVDEEDEDAEMIHERAHVVEADAPVVEGDSGEASSLPPRDEPRDMPVVLTPIHPALRPDEAIVPSSSDPLVVGQKRRLLGSLASDDEGADAGPAKRTRANLSLVDIDFDFIERMLPLPDEDAFGEYGEYDDKEEWSNFLSAISLDFQVPEEDDAGARADDEGTGAGSAGDDEEDEEDEDYAVIDPKAARVERRLALATLPPAVRRKTKRRKTKYVYRPKSERPQYRERPIYSFVRTRSARQAAERKKRAAEETAAAAPGKTPTDIMMSNLGDAAKVSGRPSARPLAPSIPRGDFTPAQVAALHKTIHDHVQLLLQTYARTAWNQTPEAQLVARRTRGLIEQLVHDTKQRLMLKVQSKAPPYPTEWFASPMMRCERYRKTSRRQKLAWFTIMMRRNGGPRLLTAFSPCSTSRHFGMRIDLFMAWRRRACIFRCLRGQMCRRRLRWSRRRKAPTPRRQTQLARRHIESSAQPRPFLED